MTTSDSARARLKASEALAGPAVRDADRTDRFGVGLVVAAPHRSKAQARRQNMSAVSIQTGV